jgi:hypothetical protein
VVFFLNFVINRKNSGKVEVVKEKVRVRPWSVVLEVLLRKPAVADGGEYPLNISIKKPKITKTRGFKPSVKNNKEANNG